MQLNISQKHKRKSHAALPIGIVIAVLVVVGLLTVIFLSVGITNRIMDNTKAKEKFGNIILPVLMFDPVPFEKASDLDQAVLLQSSLWATLMEKKDSYTTDDEGMMLVPATDVDVSCSKLFGSDIQLQHQSFGGYLISYTYDEIAEVYKVPADAQVGVYTPKVTKISKKGDIYTLLVGYLPPGNSWAMDLSGKKYEPEPDKYMIYELKKFKDHYQLMAIKDPPEGAVPGVPQQQQNQQNQNNQNNNTTQQSQATDAV